MKILLHRQFKSDFKSLKKKYPSIEKDVNILVESLESNPIQGISLGKNCFKVRLKIVSKGKGKSSGARVVTYLQIINDELWLLTMYDKSEIENIKDDFLDDLIKFLD